MRVVRSLVHLVPLIPFVTPANKGLLMEIYIAGANAIKTFAHLAQAVIVRDVRLLDGTPVEWHAAHAIQTAKVSTVFLMEHVRNAIMVIMDNTVNTHAVWLVQTNFVTEMGHV